MKSKEAALALDFLATISQITRPIWLVWYKPGTDRPLPTSLMMIPPWLPIRSRGGAIDAMHDVIGFGGWITKEKVTMMPGDSLSCRHS